MREAVALFKFSRLPFIVVHYDYPFALGHPGTSDANNGDEAINNAPSTASIDHTTTAEVTVAVGLAKVPSSTPSISIRGTLEPLSANPDENHCGWTSQPAIQTLNKAHYSPVLRYRFFPSLRWAPFSIGWNGLLSHR